MDNNPIKTTIANKNINNVLNVFLIIKNINKANKINKNKYIIQHNKLLFF